MNVSAICIVDGQHAARLITLILAMNDVQISECDVANLIAAHFISDFHGVTGFCIPQNAVFYQNILHIPIGSRVGITCSFNAHAVIRSANKGVSHGYVFTAYNIDAVTRANSRHDVYILNLHIPASARNQVPRTTVHHGDALNLHIIAKHHSNHWSAATIFFFRMPYTTIQNAVSHAVGEKSIHATTDNTALFQENRFFRFDL